MTKWHLRASDNSGAACKRKADLIVGPKDFAGLLNSSSCERCQAIFKKQRKPNPMTNKLMTPTVHLNGTSREELLHQLAEAAAAVFSAREALSRAAPHGRDYYPQGPNAINQAIEQHLARYTKLNDIHRDLQAIAEAID